MEAVPDSSVDAPHPKAQPQLGALRFEARAVLLDIEGTISPLSFVRDVLFPYSRAHLSKFVAEHRADPLVANLLAQASALAGGGDPVSVLERWQANDEKVPPLKKLQGLIWDTGYRSGAFRSSIFADALEAMRRWNKAGVGLYIYSSGSVQAQLQFFEFNTAGDLRALFSGHYDTDVGPKIEPASYRRIAGEIGERPDNVVFFSDSSQELAAARASGIRVVRVVKEDTKRDPGFPEITDFSDVCVTLRQL